MNVDEETFQNWLEQYLNDIETILENGVDDIDDIDPIDYDEEGEGIYPESVRTFDSVMMLTDNKGLVVTLSDGSEFQLTIVKSK